MCYTIILVGRGCVRKILTLISMAVFLVGCFAVSPPREPEKGLENSMMQVSSAGFIGCEPHLIEISNVVTFPVRVVPRSWEAKCGSAVFICSESEYNGTALTLHCAPKRK